MKDVAVKLSLHVELAEWFFKTQDVVLSTETVVNKIKELKKKRGNPDPVTREELNRLLSQARAILETPARRCSVIWIRGQGYRCGDAEDLALYTAKWIKRTLMCADRTTRLANIADRTKMPAALMNVFAETQPKISKLGAQGKRFVDAMLQYVKEEKTKQIEAKK